MKSVTFDNGRGFALGYDEAAPSPFVTWQFTETENGQRDYYWGHYHSDGQIAEKDFAKRIDDYKELFQVQERTGGREPTEYYRYYSTQRPVDLGTFPKPPGNAPVEIINFDERRMAEAGISNAGAYMRKMALNGYILHVDLAPVKELVSLQRRCANNLNQVAVHANTFGVYPEEIAGLQRDYEKLWGRVSDVLMELSALVEK